MHACPAPDQFKRLLAEDLSPAERGPLETHVEKCPRCQQTLEQLTRDSVMAAVGSKAAAGSPAATRKSQAQPVVEAAQDTQAGVPAANHPDLREIDFLAPPQAPGELGRLGGYRILKILGVGGMGVVFQAEDVQLKRLVALKAMKPALAASETSKQRFLREAQAAAAIEHDHIIPIYQVGEDRGVAFLAMPFLKGEALDHWLDRGRKPVVAQVLRLGREIAKGLQAAHERGLIHRDIKPANIWLESPSGRVKILDFGLARGSDDNSHLTQTGMIVGTPAYMAPEQAQAEPVDARTDLFSLGCVLYRLCTGQLPFKGKDTMSTLMSLAMDTPKPVQELNPEIPTALSELVMQLLAKDRTQRPQSAKEVVQRLTAIEKSLQGPSAAAVAVPVAPAAPAVNPFADLTEAAPQLVVPPKPASARPAPTKVLRKAEPRPPAHPARKAGPGGLPLGKRPAVLIGLAAVVLVGGALAGWVIIRDRDGKEVGRHPVPEGGRVEVSGIGEAKPPTAQIVPPPRPDDAAWIKEVSNLPAAQQIEAVRSRLQERNPGLDDKLFTVTEGGTVTQLAVNGAQLADLTPLRALTGLRKLYVLNGPFADLTQLQGLPLTHLTLGMTRVSDLSPLRGMPLTELILFRTRVTDVTPLQGMPLTILSLEETGVADLSPLRGMKLVSLGCGKTRVSDLSPLQGMPLRRLSYNADLKPGDDFLRSFSDLESVNGQLARGVAAHFPFYGRCGDIPSLKTDAAGDFTIEAVLTPTNHNEAWFFGTEHFGLKLSGDCPRAIFENKKIKNKDVPTARDKITYGLRTHLAAVKSADSLRLYVNGKLATRYELSEPVALDTAEAFQIGDNMWLHEARVSRIARYRDDFTPQGRFTPDADTLALYHCDEGEGDVLTDASGNGHHAQLKKVIWLRGVLDPPLKPGE